MIETNKFYEGEINKDKLTGFGTEYYPMELAYTIYETSEKDEMRKQIEMHYLREN